jgi:hypothetical protein
MEGDFCVVRDEVEGETTRRTRRVSTSAELCGGSPRISGKKGNKGGDTMGIRASWSLVLLSFVLTATYACSSQPMAPSRLAAQPIGSVAATSAASTQTNTVSAARFGDRTPGVVYVTSQGLYYDTFVVKDPLPMEGKFQRLAKGQTEFGPGQPGYLGGRWWEDVNANGVQDSADHFFLCPLLPPGRPTP